MSPHVSNMISARDRFIQLKFLHQAYYTPCRLAAIYQERSPSCPRCGDPEASFLHMTWSCPLLQGFWDQVLEDINQAAGTSLPQTPEIMLLNVLADPTVRKYTKLFIAYPTFFARREILLRWRSGAPPTATDWRNTLNTVLPLYKITYINRNCPSKFDQIWSSWIDSWGSLQLDVAPPDLDEDP